MVGFSWRREPTMSDHPLDSADRHALNPDRIDQPFDEIGRSPPLPASPVVVFVPGCSPDSAVFHCPNCRRALSARLVRCD